MLVIILFYFDFFEIEGQRAHVEVLKKKTRENAPIEVTWTKNPTMDISQDHHWGLPPNCHPLTTIRNNPQANTS